MRGLLSCRFAAFKQSALTQVVIFGLLAVFLFQEQ